MNIGGGQIMGALFNFFVVKKCPFCIFWTLPSVSKITPGSGMKKMKERTKTSNSIADHYSLTFVILLLG